jgi:hypothetical protein
MNGATSLRFDLRALALAGATVGIILYVLCLLFYWLVYGAEGQWMIRPFMPGLSASAGGIAVGFGWSILYGAGILWLLGWFYNRFAR